MASDWILYYWPGFPGRGDFVRLVFEEAGVKYQEENDTTIIVNEVLRGKREGYPMFAPPMIKKGSSSLFPLHYFMIGSVRKNILTKIVKIFLNISYNICFRCSLRRFF